MGLYGHLRRNGRCASCGEPEDYPGKDYIRDHKPDCPIGLIMKRWFEPILPTATP